MKYPNRGQSATLGDPHLTSGYAPELHRQIGKTVPGMAHFAATGLFGATCNGCKHYGLIEQTSNGPVRRHNRCDKYAELMGHIGPPVPATTEACRHFQPKEH